MDLLIVGPVATFADNEPNNFSETVPDKSETMRLILNWQNSFYYKDKHLESSI